MMYGQSIEKGAYFSRKNICFAKPCQMSKNMIKCSRVTNPEMIPLARLYTNMTTFSIVIYYFHIVSLKSFLHMAVAFYNKNKLLKFYCTPCYAVMFDPCSPVVTCWERADLMTVVLVVFCHFPKCVLVHIRIKGEVGSMKLV